MKMLCWCGHKHEKWVRLEDNGRHVVYVRALCSIDDCPCSLFEPADVVVALEDEWEKVVAPRRSGG